MSQEITLLVEAMRLLRDRRKLGKENNDEYELEQTIAIFLKSHEQMPTNWEVNKSNEYLELVKKYK